MDIFCCKFDCLDTDAPSKYGTTYDGVMEVHGQFLHHSIPLTTYWKRRVLLLVEQYILTKTETSLWCKIQNQRWIQRNDSQRWYDCNENFKSQTCHLIVNNAWIRLDGTSSPVFLLLGITLKVKKGRVTARIQYVNPLYSVIWLV